MFDIMSSFQSIVRPVITICSGPIYTARVQASIGSMFPVETAANAKNAPVILFFIMFIFTFIIEVVF